MLAWLKTLAEPGKEEAVLLTENDMNSYEPIFIHQHLVFPGVAMAGRVRVPSWEKFSWHLA